MTHRGLAVEFLYIPSPPAGEGWGEGKSSRMVKKIKTLQACSIERLIFLLRGQKVMFDKDLAELYGVETKALKQAVKRNIERFPSDVVFELTEMEFKNLRSQFVTSSSKWGGARYMPMAFSRNKELQCFQAFCAAKGRLRSMSKSCAHLCGCVGC